MKTPLVVGIVVGVHCVAVGSVLLIQGCGTTPLDPELDARVGPGPMPPLVGTVETSAEDITPAAPAGVLSHSGGTTTYVVRQGDNLSSIAKRYGVKTSDIMALNKITNANRIWKGQKLLLPGKAATDKPVTTSRPSRKPARQPGAGESAYVVEKGDCLSAIAVQFGVKTAALREANGITGDRIVVGQTLIIPKGGISKPTPAAGSTTVAAPDSGRPPVAGREPDRSGAGDPVAVVQDPVGVPDAPQPVAPPSAAIKIHVVAEGEDLYSIAMMYAVRTASIKDLNGLAGTELKVGQKLKIPITEE